MANGPSSIEFSSLLVFATNADDFNATSGGNGAFDNHVGEEDLDRFLTFEDLWVLCCS